MSVTLKFGLSNNLPKPFEENKKNAIRVKKLLALPDAALITRVGKHYVQNFIPTPIENEDEYWMCSAFPGDDYDIPVRVNIYWHEVMNISQDFDYVEDKWNIVIFTHRDFLLPPTIEELKKKIKGLTFDKEYTYERGLDSPLAAIVPLESYFGFVSDKKVAKSIEQYNYQLSKKGRKVHKGHNFELARLLFKP